jgi:hypothetical protein
MFDTDFWSHLPYLIIGVFIISVGIWLLRTPRNARIGLMLGSMLVYRILGIIFVLFGLSAVIAGFGLESIGPFPITIN